MAMNADRYVTVLVAVCCLVTVGAASANLDSAMSTDPDEAIDLDTRLVPVGTDDLVDLDRQVNGNADGGEAAGGRGSGDAQGARAGQDGETGGRDATGGSGDSSAASAGAGDESQSGASQSDSADAHGGQSESESTTLAARSWLDALLALLSNALVLLGLLAVVVGAVIVLRRRKAGGDPREGTGVAVPPGRPSPSNDVSRAWYEMVRRLGLDGQHAMTPGERASAATERGADPEAAASLTRLFEDVRYGEEPVTEKRRRSARRWLERLRGDPSERRTDGSGEPGRERGDR